MATAPAGLEVRVGGVVLQDASEPVDPARAAGRLLIAVGASADSLPALVFTAAAAGAPALACRSSQAWSQKALDAAEGEGVALLAVPDHVPWGELYELVRAAIEVDHLEPRIDTVGAEWRELNDLTALVEAVAAITGGSAGIDDMHSRILAFSGTQENDPMRTASILTRRVPAEFAKELRELGVYDRLLESDDVLHLQFDNLASRRAIAIKRGRTALGSLWLIGDDEAISPDADEVLRQAAPIAALQIMREQATTDVERRMRESSVAALLEEGSASRAALKQVGLPREGRLVVVVLEVTDRNASAPAALGTRLVDLLSIHLHGYQRPTATAAIAAAAGEAEGDRVYVVASSRGPDDVAALRKVVESCIEHARRTLGAELRAGIGHEVDAGADLSLARRSADDCLALEPATGTVTVFDAVHDRALLADVDEFVAGWRGGPSAAFEILAAHDAEHGTAYVETLRALLDTFGNANEVGRRLHLHVNSVRYRIKRIAEITGIDLGDGATRLALELTLRSQPPAGEAGGGRVT